MVKWDRDKQWRISFVWAVAFVICLVWFWYMQCGFSDWEQLCLLDWTTEDGNRPSLWNVFCSEYWMVVEVQIMSSPKSMGIRGCHTIVAEGSIPLGHSVTSQVTWMLNSSVIYHYQNPLELKICKQFWILSCDTWRTTHIFLRFCVYLVIKKIAVL